MKRIVLQRLVVLPFVFLGISLLVFLVSHLIPGDPAVAFAGGGTRADPRVVAEIRREWGLDKPLPIQYLRYVGRLVHGDLGYSNIAKGTVVDLTMRRLPATLELTGAALLLGLPLGLALGVRSAWRQGSVTDHIARMLAITGVSLPVFWAPLLLIFVFSVQLRWLPISGRLPAFSDFHGPTGIYTLDAIVTGQFGQLPTILAHLALPAITLAIIPAAVMARFARSIFIDVLSENYIRTATAYGIKPRTILWQLAGKNAMLPLITLTTLLVPSLIVGDALIESVFSWPGVGKFLLGALDTRDYVIVQSLTLLVGVLYVFMNLLADLSYAALDPRTRRS
jgi:peptide/nickel transport system permease protein